MTTSSPEDEQRARETLKVLSELKEKTELLSEHVESRKDALEEEIEESLHEAIQNARDSLERIQENIEPKLEKIIQERLAVIRHQMDELKYEARESVREEIDKKSDALNQKLLGALEGTVRDQVGQGMVELRAKLGDAVRDEVGGSLKDIRETTRAGLAKVQQMVWIGLGAAVLAGVGVVILLLTR
jgi:HD-GYP domain-containing protein (c-di-GMP phosphodiesterase class II)